MFRRGTLECLFTGSCSIKTSSTIKRSRSRRTTSKAARCLTSPPLCGERPRGCDVAVTQGQVSDHPSHSTKHHARLRVVMAIVPSQREKNVPGKVKHGQHLVVELNDMLAIALNSSVNHALPWWRQTVSICRTVQVLPECLRLSQVPAVHCIIAKNQWVRKDVQTTLPDE